MDKRVHALPLVALLGLAACGGQSTGGTNERSADDVASSTGGFLSFGGRFDINRCLDVEYDQIAPGARIDSSNCNNTPAQRFIYTSARQIVPVQNPALCLEVQYANYGAGVVQLWTCNGTPAQQWTISNGTIQPAGGPGYCLDVYAANTGNTATVDVAPCNGTAAQLWWPFGFTVTLGSSERAAGGGLLSAECLDVQYDNSQPGSNLDDTFCNGTDAQRFTFTEAHQILNHGLCLDVLGANVQAGVLHMQPCNGTGAQAWQLQQASGGVTVVSRLAGAGGSSECLDVFANSPAPGTPVDLAACNGTNAQLWHPFVTSAPGPIQ